MRITHTLLLFSLIFGVKVNAQNDQKFLDSLYNEIEFLIGDKWYFEKTNNGFQVTYCKSCKEAYIKYLDTTDFFSRELSREAFFQKELIDSVSYYRTVSISPIPLNWTNQQRIEYFSELYKAEDVLKFEVTIEKKWSDEKIKIVLSNNNQLRDSILKEPLYKSNMSIFSDYRFWLPEDYLSMRTQGLDFYFERLPYESLIIDESIFILHNKPFFFSRPMLVDKNDPEFFEKEENELEDERRRTLKIIALTLGIHDYNIVN